MNDALDFDITVREIADTWTVEARTRIGFECSPQPLFLPFDPRNLPVERRHVAMWVAQLRPDTAMMTMPFPGIPQAIELGTLLFERLFAEGDIRRSFYNCRNILGSEFYKRLRVRLWLPTSLYSIPWELLYDPHHRHFLIIEPSISIVRCRELADPMVDPQHVKGPLQLVALLSNPSNMNEDVKRRVDLTRHHQTLTEATRDQVAQKRLALDVLQHNNTLTQLRHRLHNPIHILHILCHGDLDQEEGEYVLLFEDDKSEIAHIPATTLCLLLQDVRLVFLNACQSALPAGNHVSSSIGASLLANKVQAVIAMQFDLPEEVAAELTRVFYEELAFDFPVDRAFASACSVLFYKFRDQLAWAIPVLFLRSVDGRLFVRDEMQPQHSLDRPKPVAYNAARRFSPNDPLRFWQAHEFFKNPFATTSAERELEAGGLPFFYPPDLFDEWVGDPQHPQSLIVFAPTGRGKTSCRFVLGQSVGSLHPHPALVVRFSSFDVILDSLLMNPTHPVSTKIYRQLLIQETLGALLTRLHAYPEQRLLLEHAPEAWAKFCAMQQLYGPPDALMTLPPEMTRWYDYFQKSNISFAHWLDHLATIAQAAGFAGVYVLLDSIDELADTKENPALAITMLKPLLDASDILHGRGFAFKFFLPEALEEPMRQQRLRCIDHVPIYHLHWEVDQLRSMLQHRLQRCYMGSTITGTDLRLASLCERDSNIDERLAQSAQGSPRNLIQLAGQIIDAHCLSVDDVTAPISQETISKIIT